MTHEVVDFRKPGRVSEDIGQMLSQWQTRVREAVEVRWGQCVPCGVKIGLSPPSPLTGAELRELDPPSISYRIDVAETGHTTLFVLHRQLALALTKEMLGDSTGELPDDRRLTDIETTCLDFLIDELRNALQSGQKLNPPRRLTNQGKVFLKELHAQFPENVSNTDVGFQVKLPYATESVHWILPQDVTLDMVAAASSVHANNGHAREALQRLVLSAPGDLSVRLGAARVQLAKLAKLKPGDVIVLDQRIDDPLVAKLGGQELFRGWGGRIGKHQAYQIDEVMEPRKDL